MGCYPPMHAQFGLGKSFFVPLCFLPRILTQFPQDLHPSHHTPAKTSSASPSFCALSLSPLARSCITLRRSPLAYGIVWDKEPKNKVEDYVDVEIAMGYPPRRAQFVP